MTFYEAITTATAVVAMVISAVALYRSGIANRIAKDANELARAQDDLAKLHLEREQDRRNRTSLSLAFVKHQVIGSNGRPRTDYRIAMTNRGETVANDAGFEITSDDSPVISQDYNAKLPASLSPGQSIEVLAAVHMDTPSRLDATVFWTNPDGTQEREDRTITM